MKNLTKIERVEVMALFGYKMTPCQPLSFRRGDGETTNVEELLSSSARFNGAAMVHRFEVMTEAGENVLLEFNSRTLAWHIVETA